MNIWIVNQYGITSRQAGPTRHFDFARELVRSGHSVTIIASSFDHFVHVEAHLKDGEAFRREVIEGVEMLWMRSPEYKNNGIARIYNMSHFAASLWLRRSMLPPLAPDVVIGSSPTLFAAWAALRIARRVNVPFVLEVRDLWPQSLVDLGNVSARHPIVTILRWLEAYLYRHAAHIITLLPHSTAHMIALGADPNGITWIPNGVRLDDPAPSLLNRQQSPFVALYAGAHGTANALDTLLDCAAVLQERGWTNRICIRLVGNGPQKLRLQARAASEALNIVEFRDQVPKEEVTDLMREADALVLTLRKASLYEQGISPNKLYHYMAAARPVVFATQSSNNPIQDAQCGLTVPAEDPVQLADALQIVAQMSNDERQVLALRARMFVERYHNIRSLAINLERVLLKARALRPSKQDGVLSEVR